VPLVPDSVIVSKRVAHGDMAMSGALIEHGVVGGVGLGVGLGTGVGVGVGVGDGNEGVGVGVGEGVMMGGPPASASCNAAILTPMSVPSLAAL